MGKKKSKVSHVEGGEEQKQHNDNGSIEAAGAGADKDKSVNVVLKVDLHCEGCATKAVKCIRGFEGVDAVKCEWDKNKLTVTGDVDPVKLREKVEAKTHKKVELISPIPPKKEKKEESIDDGEEKPKKQSNEKDTEKPKEKKKKEKSDKKDKKKKKGSDGEDKKPDEKEEKPKEVPVTTAVMKVNFHCDGCIQKIHKIVTKTSGYQEMKIDRQKDLLTVTGAMDMKALAECLKKHLRKDVEIVPPKKDGEKKEKGGGGDAGDGGGKGKGGGEENGGGGGGGGGLGMEGFKMQVPYGYPYSNANLYMYGPGPGYPAGPPGPDFYQAQYYPYVAHAPQMFSDENPNACSVM